MEFHDIAYEVRAGLAEIRFARPESLNAARVQTHLELQEALGRADDDPGVRAVIVTGEGRTFCAGTDLADGFQLPEGGDPVSGAGVPPDVGGVTVLRLFEMQKPVVAAINGPAVGFGLTFTLAMDLRLSVPGVKLAFPFTRRGICAESCSSWFLPRLVGMQTAQDWMLSGRTFLSEEGHARGLIHELHAPEVLMDRARAWAAEIRDQTAPASVALTRRLLWQMAGADHPAQAHAFESRAIAERVAAPDAAEGVAAFRARRAPAFTSQPEDVGYMAQWWQGAGRG